MAAKGPNGTLNPYAFFGRPDVWPRGLPLERILEGTFDLVLVMEKAGS